MDVNEIREPDPERRIVEALWPFASPLTMSGTSVYPSWRMPILLCYVIRLWADRPEQRCETEQRNHVSRAETPSGARSRKVSERIAQWTGRWRLECADGKTQPYDYQWWPLAHYLDMGLAVKHLGVQNALALFEDNSMHDLAARASFAAFLHSAHTQLYSLDELAALLDRFRFYLIGTNTAL